MQEASQYLKSYRRFERKNTQVIKKHDASKKGNYVIVNNKIKAKYFIKK